MPERFHMRGNAHMRKPTKSVPPSPRVNLKFLKLTNSHLLQSPQPSSVPPKVEYWEIPLPKFEQEKKKKKLPTLD